MLDPLNLKYAALLKEKHRKTESHSGPVRIAETAAVSTEGALAFSTAIAPAPLLHFLPTTPYASLTDSIFRERAKKAILIRRKMFAGIGTSIERQTHLAKHRKVMNPELGSKGTDLFIEIPHPLAPQEKVALCFAEAQILQGILSAERGDYKKVFFQDLVSDETKRAVHKVWEQPCLLQPELSYREYVAKSPFMELRNPVLQANLPTYNENGEETLRRRAPGGHGFFGFETLQELLHSNCASEEMEISFLSNGEDLAAYPDPQTVGWMIENKIPLCMVVTEKTENDRKGGQLAIVTEAGTPRYVSLIETAQAKAAGQLDLFEELGLSIRNKDQSAYFNTNLALFNRNALVIILSQLRSKLGEKALLDAMTPDLIHNWKEQIDEDGVKRRYLQLEGAMGSVYLNLDKLYRKVEGKPLVHFLLVSKQDRHRFFAPIKTAFDLYLQYYSNQYSWDPARFCPISNNPGKYPQVTLTSQDVETVLGEFQNKDLSSHFLES